MLDYGRGEGQRKKPGQIIRKCCKKATYAVDLGALGSLDLAAGLSLQQLRRRCRRGGVADVAEEGAEPLGDVGVQLVEATARLDHAADVDLKTGNRRKNRQLSSKLANLKYG